MIGYTACEQAVAERLTYHLGLADPSLCQKGNMDALFTAMQLQSANLGVLVEYETGSRGNHEPFNTPVWVWGMLCVALVRFTGDSTQIEMDARSTIDKVLSVFDGHPTLGQKVAKAEIGDIGRPEVTKINDVPFYLIPFSVAVIERI